MDWSRSYASSWRLYRVEEATWADGEPVGDVESASITRTADGALLEAGSLTVTADDFPTGYYRLVLTAVDDSGDAERQEICTMLFEATGGTADYGTEQLDANGRSVLHPAAAASLSDGSYAPANSDGAAYVGRLLESVLAAPVEVEASFVLMVNVVHPFGCSVLDAAWDVLNAGGCVLQIDGHGTVHVVPMPSEPVLTLDSTTAALLSPGIKSQLDISEVPNRYIAVGRYETSTAVNDDADSPTSVPSRGYRYDVVDTSPTPVDGETIERYAQRRLAELSTVYDTRTYTREYAPGVYPYSIVSASLEEVNMGGLMRVQSQSLSCGNGITVTEESAREVSLWSS